MDEKKKNVQQINIELDEKVSSGEYANFVVVTHSPAEFVLDFTRILPGVPKAKVHSRIESEDLGHLRRAVPPGSGVPI